MGDSTACYLDSRFWDPSIFDHEFDEGGDEWYALMDHAKNPHWELFDKFGNYRK